MKHTLGIIQGIERCYCTTMKHTLGIKQGIEVKSEGCSARHIAMEKMFRVLKFLIKQLANFRVKLLGTDLLTGITNFFVCLTLLYVP